MPTQTGQMSPISLPRQDMDKPEGIHEGVARLGAVRPCSHTGPCSGLTLCS